MFSLSEDSCELLIVTINLFSRCLTHYPYHLLPVFKYHLLAVGGVTTGQTQGLVSLCGQDIQHYVVCGPNRNGQSQIEDQESIFS